MVDLRHGWPFDGAGNSQEPGSGAGGSLKYYFAILFFPAFTIVGLTAASLGVPNNNISQPFTFHAFAIGFGSFAFAAAFVYLGLEAIGVDSPRRFQPDGAEVLKGRLFLIYCAMVVATIVPLVLYGVPTLNGQNRYIFLALPGVSAFRQLDNLISFVFVAALVVRLGGWQRNFLWAVLMVLALLYGEKFSSLIRIVFFEVLIRLYWKERQSDRAALFLYGLITLALVGGLSLYWWNGEISGIVQNVIIRAGKQASCTIAASDQLGFLTSRIGLFWNFFEASAKGVSYFHEVSRDLSLRADQSVMGDSFPCVYMAMSANLWVLGIALALSTLAKIVLVRFMFLFVDHARLGLFAFIGLFFYVRYLDGILASDKFHLLSHPLFLASACFMLLILVAGWRRRVAQ